MWPSNRTPMSVPDPAAALAPGECMVLLRSVSTGRLLYTDNALPAVRPVTFAAPDGEIVVPTGGDGWYARFHGTLLAFQTEQLDPATGTGWSVVAVGRARTVRGTDGLIGFDDAATARWQTRPDERYLVLDVEHVSGVRLTLPAVRDRPTAHLVPARHDAPAGPGTVLPPDDMPARGTPTVAAEPTTGQAATR